MSRKTAAEKHQKPQPQEPQEPQSQEPQSPQDRSRPSGCLLRVYWMLLGNVLVAVFAFRIVQETSVFGAVDVLYWLAAAGLVAARFVDIAYREGQTAEGEPATMQDFRRYALTAVAVTVALWLGVHLLR